MSDSTEGASNNQRLLAAAREDNEELLLEIFEQGKFDINYQDGLGNTALHYAASHGSAVVLEHILSYEECDVDPINRLEGATPLHLAVKLEDPELRRQIVESLLEAGADTSIKDKNGDRAIDLLAQSDTETRQLFRKAQAQASVAQYDVASDDDDDGEGDGSGSE
ncbi:ankyrin [Panus rudis PR-1116 ss-1]|nr:ankyrin [Panus rudis PR-1116 ss-1]